MTVRAASADASLTDRALQHIREAILDWRLAPGQSLSENALAAELAMSRTPIRQALWSLRAEGLVVVAPARGVFVSQIVLRDVVEAFQLREGLESWAARLAAANEQVRPALRELRSRQLRAHALIDAGQFDEYYQLNAELDNLILEGAANTRVASILRSLWDQGRRLRRLAYMRVERLHESVDEHVAIIDALVAGDEAGAEAAVRRHIQNSFQHALRRLQSPSALDGAVRA